MEHRFRWLWNFTFIPLVLVILGFGFHMKNKADEKLADTNASIGIVTKNIENINNEIKTLNSKASTDVLLNNYTEVNKALGVATQRVIDLQNKRLDAYSIGDAVERQRGRPHQVGASSVISRFDCLWAVFNQRQQ